MSGKPGGGGWGLPRQSWLRLRLPRQGLQVGSLVRGHSYE